MSAASAGKLPGPGTGWRGASEIGSSLAHFWSAENLAGRFAATAVSFSLFLAKDEAEKVQNSRRSFSRRRRSSSKLEPGNEGRSQAKQLGAQQR